jgi:NADH-quinone oxidoreductase subunit N
MLTADIATVLPELLLALAGLGLLMFGVFQKGDATRVVSVLAILSFAAALLVMAKGDTQTITAFGGLIQVDRFTVFAKGLILLAAAFTTAMSVDFLEKEKIGRFEYPVLIVLSTLGMLIMVSSGDFLTLYLGLELQSLPLYVLAAYNRDSLRATEAGVKYFVLGALASGLLLYGISLVWRRPRGPLPIWALSSAWCSSWRGWRSRFRRCRSICGRLTCMKAPPPR